MAGELPFTLRPADLSDYSSLLEFINSQGYVHRHLDWRDTLSWLGYQPFWILEEDHEIMAALALPPDPEQVAWVRLFAVEPFLAPDLAWSLLFERAVKSFKNGKRPAIVSLALRDWFAEMLVRHNFEHYQDIVVLVYQQKTLPDLPINPKIAIRPMVPADLPVVCHLDHLAFEPIWQLSDEDLTQAYAKGSYSTIAELDGNVIGYQMCSSSGYFAHLARLAVSPELQRQRIGYTLVRDLLSHFITSGDVWEVTVNTQNTNYSSLALYQKMGFKLTGETFPVMMYQG